MVYIGLVSTWRIRATMLRRRASERMWMWLAWRMPRKLAYWCTIRLGAHATQGLWGHQVVPELTFHQALERWGYDNKDQTPIDPHLMKKVLEP